jgi:hypothetical protein
MILSQIYAATFSFADTPEAKRPGYSLYIDEFQKFASSDTARLFTEGRKYKVRQTLAHQTRTQLTLKEVASATFTANTVIAFRTEPDDSTNLARLFTGIDLFPEIEHIDRDFMPKMKRHKSKAVTDLWARYIRHWQDADNKEPKRRREDGYTISEWPRWNLGHGIVEYHPNQVRAALNILDELLYYAMQHKEHDSDLEQSLVHLFANWYGEEQQELFAKHVDAAVDALMKEPIGEKRETDKAEIEDYLIKLENRHALIKCAGQPTHAIKTLPLISGVSQAETRRRIDSIEERTRAKYCKSREEIEAELSKTATSDEEEQTPDGITLQTLARSHPALALAQIRMDIEKLIKVLYAKSIPQTAKASRRSLGEMVQNLRNQDILDSSLTSTLFEIISTANLAVHSDVSLKPEQVLPLVRSSRDAIDALTHLLKTDEDTSTWARFEEIDE